MIVYCDYSMMSLVPYYSTHYDSSTPTYYMYSLFIVVLVTYAPSVISH
jgi:hypothetical protein